MFIIFLPPHKVVSLHYYGASLNKRKKFLFKKLHLSVLFRFVTAENSQQISLMSKASEWQSVQGTLLNTLFLCPVDAEIKVPSVQNTGLTIVLRLQPAGFETEELVQKLQSGKCQDLGGRVMDIFIS